MEKKNIKICDLGREWRTQKQDNLVRRQNPPIIARRLTLIPRIPTIFYYFFFFDTSNVCVSSLLLNFFLFFFILLFHVSFVVPWRETCVHTCMIRFLVLFEKENSNLLFFFFLVLWPDRRNSRVQLVQSINSYSFLVSIIMSLPSIGLFLRLILLHRISVVFCFTSFAPTLLVKTIHSTKELRNIAPATYAQWAILKRTYWTNVFQ